MISAILPVAQVATPQVIPQRPPQAAPLLAPPAGSQDQLVLSAAAKAKSSVSVSGTLAAPDVHLDIPRFSKINDHFYRGSLPSDADLASLKQQGITTVIDLMDANSDYENEKVFVAHEKETAAALGLNWLNFSVPWGTPPSKDVQAAFLAAVNAPNETTFIHCKLGRDRTGAFVATYRIDHDGFSEKQAMDEMKGFGFPAEKYTFLTNYVHDVAAAHAPTAVPTP